MHGVQRAKAISVSQLTAQHVARSHAAHSSVFPPRPPFLNPTSPCNRCHAKAGGEQTAAMGVLSDFSDSDAPTDVTVTFPMDIQGKQCRTAGETLIAVAQAHVAREKGWEITSLSPLLQIIFPACIAGICESSWPQLASQSWAVAALGLRIQSVQTLPTNPYASLDVATWAERLAQRTSQSLGFGSLDSSRSLSLILWSLAKVNYRPRKRWLKNSRIALLKLSPLASSREICLAFWSQAMFHHPPTEEWTQRVLYHLLLRMVLYKPGETREGYKDIPSNATAGLASDAAKLVRPTLLNYLADASLYSKPDSSIGLLPSLIVWLLELEYRALPRLTLGGMTAQQYAMCAYSLALISFQPSDKVMGAFYSGSGAIMARQCLVDIHVLNLCVIGRATDASQLLLKRGKKSVNLMPRRHSTSQYRQWQQLTRREMNGEHIIDPDGHSVLSLLQLGQKQLNQSTQVGLNASRSTGKSHVFIHPKDLSSVLISLARIKQNPPTWWMRLYEAVLLPRISLLSLKQLTALLYGYGALRRRPPRLISRNVMQLVRGRWKRVDPKSACNLLVALARVKVRPQRSWVQGLLRHALSSKRRSALTPEGFERILWALKKMDIDPGPTMTLVPNASDAFL